MKIAYVHPEARKAVKAYFDNLHNRYPNIEGMTKWHLAKKAVYANDLADTALLKQKMGL